MSIEIIVVNSEFIQRAASCLVARETRPERGGKLLASSQLLIERSAMSIVNANKPIKKWGSNCF